MTHDQSHNVGKVQHPLQNIAEWRKGCSCTIGGHPSQCEPCTDGLIKGIEEWFRQQAPQAVPAQTATALADTQPAAQEMEQKKPSFYAAFGGSGTALPQYSAYTEDGVIYNVLAVARNEGFKGSGLDRLMELGWVVRPVFRDAALAAQAKQGGV